MYFSKMQEFGHDYMVIDAVTQNVYLSPDVIRRLADRHRGVGFDRLILIEPPYNPDLDFHFRMFNRDGIETQQYGEGLCCAAKFIRLRGLSSKADIGIGTDKGTAILQQRGKDNIELQLAPPNFDPVNLPFKAQKAENTYLLRAGGQTLFCGIVGLNELHCIVQWDQKESHLMHTAHEALSQHDRFNSRPTVSFMRVLSKNKITLSFASVDVQHESYISLASASAVVAILQGHAQQYVDVQMMSNMIRVYWSGEQQPIRILGQANHIYDGCIKL